MHAELEQRLRLCGNLPSLPAVALKMVELANNPDVQLNDLVRVISMDPALVTKLFRAANSPLYGFNRKVTNLRQVLSLLGLQGALALTLGFSLVATGRDAGAIPLNTEQFWRRSLMAATACRILGERLSMKNLEELFLAGLLQGIGILALSIMMPQPYGVLLKEATECPEGATAVLNYQRLAELERERLGDDHAAAGAWLMQHWRLPDYLTVATAGSLDPDHGDAPDRYRALVQSVALATRIADIWTRPHDWQNSPEVAKLAQQWFGLETDRYMEILEQIGAKFPEIAALFQVKSLDEIQIAGILDQAREALDIRAVQRWPEGISRNTLPAEPPRPMALPNQLASIPTLASTRSVRSQHDPATRPSTGQYAFDALTGLLNQPRLSGRLRQELMAAKDQDWPLSVVLLDVDNLGKINESCGDGVGDQVLVALARFLSGHIRHQDVAARYRDDEFALLLPASGVKAARHLIEQLMELIRGWEPMVEGRQSLRMTISAGLATYPETGLADCHSSEQLLEAASQALRQAQNAGGSQLMVYGANPPG
jgi:diguanylate cyclase (GGDEF)-like protein